MDGLTGAGHLARYLLHFPPGLGHLIRQLVGESGQRRFYVGGHQVVGLIPVRRLPPGDHLPHQLGKGGRHLLKERPQPLLRLGEVGLLLFQLGHSLQVELVVVLVLVQVLLVPGDEEVPQGGEGIGQPVVGIPHLLEQQAAIAGQRHLGGRHLFVGNGLQLIEGRLRQGAGLQQHQGVGRQVIFGMGQGPHLLLRPLEGLEGPSQRRCEPLLLYGSPGLLPLLLDARTLRGILAEDEVGPQGGDGGDQGFLARLVPLQGGQGLGQQGLLGRFNPAELMVDKGGGENDEQIDKTEAQQQLA
ncbi:hypothetical protein D3C71_746140 [compost metagenome]